MSCGTPQDLHAMRPGDVEIRRAALERQVQGLPHVEDIEKLLRCHLVTAVTASDLGCATSLDWCIHAVATKGRQEQVDHTGTTCCSSLCCVRPMGVATLSGLASKQHLTDKTHSTRILAQSGCLVPINHDSRVHVVSLEMQRCWQVESSHNMTTRL